MVLGPHRTLRNAAAAYNSPMPADGTQAGLDLAALDAISAAIEAGAGLPEGVVDGETGVLVAERDVGGLAGALRSLLDDRERRGAMSRAAVEHAKEKFDLRRQAARLEALYDEILST